MHSITAWIFGVLVARAFWNTALMAAMFVSSALVSLGVFAKRINIVMTSMFIPLVGLEPGIPEGRAGPEFRARPDLPPAWVEAGILLGPACFMALLLTLGVRYLVVPERRRS